ncbi:unnamed protein product [Prorocentrum cordatum]|uniref:N-acetyltransferase domain-containing protein n=1 Tax=Prorocentrum cordatum TaxID=2364126 RepID=A0ABN9TNE3_9DINO|nr:unnamed protein product [Polarella glacialis]
MVAEPASRRRGLAREALSLMMGYCARELSTASFVAKIKDHNGPSIALFEGLGFQLLRAVPVFGEVWYELRGCPAPAGAADDEGREAALAQDLARARGSCSPG